MWWWREAANEEGTINIAAFLKKVAEAVNITFFPKKEILMPATKSVFASTTMWFNFGAILLEGLQGSGVIGQVVPPEYALPVVTVVNLLLRWFKTAQPVSITAPLPPPPSG